MLLNQPNVSFWPRSSNAKPVDPLRTCQTQIIQRAIVDAEIQPDLRVEMLQALKAVVRVADRATVEFDMARDVIKRAEG